VAKVPAGEEVIALRQALAEECWDQAFKGFIRNQSL